MYNDITPMTTVFINSNLAILAILSKKQKERSEAGTELILQPSEAKVLTGAETCAKRKSTSPVCYTFLRLTASLGSITGI
jgi:hypothetical protein